MGRGRRSLRRTDAQRAGIVVAVVGEPVGRAGIVAAAGGADRAAQRAITVEDGDASEVGVEEHAVALHRVQVEGSAGLLPALLELHRHLVHMGDRTRRVLFVRLGRGANLGQGAGLGALPFIIAAQRLRAP